MLPALRSHKKYKKFVKKHIKNLQLSEKDNEVCEKLKLLNLEPLRPIVEPLYSPSKGSTARAPEDILRSFVGMSLYDFISIDHWYDFLSDKKNIASVYIIGQSPNTLISVGTHYHFIDRLWQNTSKTEQIVNLKNKKKKSVKSHKNKDEEDIETLRKKHHHILAKIEERIKTRYPDPSIVPMDKRHEAVIDAIFHTIAVQPSIEKGLVADNQFNGDSTKVATFANPNGHKVCFGKDNCHCPCKKCKEGNCDCSKEKCSCNGTSPRKQTKISS
ncbi:MAG: hypothetical protein AB1422_16645 [bacterium]